MFTEIELLPLFWVFLKVWLSVWSPFSHLSAWLGMTPWFDDYDIGSASVSPKLGVPVQTEARSYKIMITCSVLCRIKLCIIYRNIAE